MIPDPRNRRVKIPVRVAGDRVIPTDGNQLPAFKDGAVAELVFIASQLKNIELARALTEEHTWKLLDADTVVYFGMSRDMMENVKVKGVIDPGPCTSAWPYLLVEARLKNELWVLSRKNKPYSLLGCECEIPILKSEAISLNHAFTMISTAFETRRQSHTGNVFERAFVFDGEFYWPLRDRCERALSKAAGQ